MLYMLYIYICLNINRKNNFNNKTIIILICNDIIRINNVYLRDRLYVFARRSHLRKRKMVRKYPAMTARMRYISILL